MNIGKDLLGKDWDDYKSLMSDAHMTFSQKTIIWLKQDIIDNRYQEDQDPPNTSIPLLVLLNYNYKRSWPINLGTESGEEDQQSIQVLINKEYLRVNNYLDSNGAFIYDEGYDRFVIDGTTYKSLGDTAAGQMQSDDVFFTIVIKRVQLPTGHRR